jgi:hypothetical protein
MTVNKYHGRNGPATFSTERQVNKPRKKRKLKPKTKKHLDCFVIIYDTVEQTVEISSAYHPTLNMTGLEIAMLQAENLPQATGLRP